MRKPGIKWHWLPGFAVVAGIGAGIAIITAGTSPAPSLIAPGTTVLRASDAGITALVYRTRAITLTAQRPRLAGPFAVRVTFADGRATQQCEASPDLAGQLPALSGIVAKRQLTRQQVIADFPVQLGTLDLSDQVIAEPIPTMVVRSNKDRSAIALVYGGYAVETTIPAATFSSLDAGCAALARK
jgi:hypothetical protein